MFKFFVDKKEGDFFVLTNEILKHIKIVRIQNEKIICVYKNKFYVCEIVKNKAKILKSLNEYNEYKGDLILGAAIICKKNFDFLIQKACELGVKKIIPFISKNVAFKIDNIENKIKRWNTIVTNASQQSFRNSIPKISNIMKFQDVIKINIKNKFIAYSKTKGNKNVFFPTNSIFLIGPEGGFTSEEVQDSIDQGFQTISLGKRILRSETASTLVLSRVEE